MAPDGRKPANSRRRKNWFLAAPLAALAAILLVVGLGWWQSPSPDSLSTLSSPSPSLPSNRALLAPPTTSTTFREQAATSPGESFPDALPREAPPGRPVRVIIPSLGVTAELLPLGLEPGGAMEVPPFGLAGWYELGPKPGASGPAVIVAHVDTKSGPDVFFRLRELKPGDGIEVEYSSGQVVRFVTEQKEQTAKTGLPVERIWNQTPDPVLRLITCGGDFDNASGHYLMNVIVYAVLA